MADVNASSLWPLVVLVLNFVKQGKVPPPDVIKPLVSKVLGLGIVAGSTMVKVPQVLAVMRANSAEGLSLLAFELETLGFLIAATYGLAHKLAFTAYGETMALLVQNLILLSLIYGYQKASLRRKLSLYTFLIGWGAFFYGGYIKLDALDMLFDLNNILMLSSRFPQIIKNFRSKSTGQLSILTYGLNVAGSCARIFTTLQEKNAGPAMLRGAVLGALLNAIMVTQIVLYKHDARNKKKKV